MTKKRMPVLVVCLLIVLVALVGGAAYGINKLIPIRKQMSLSDYYGQNADGEAALILGTEKLDQKALISGDDVYLPIDVVDGYLNQRYYWDSENKKILYATPSSLTEEKASDSAGGMVWLKDNSVYLHLDYVKKYTDIDAYINKDPDRIAIQNKFSNIETVTVKKDTVIRYRGGIKSEILTEVPKNTVLRLLNEGEDWDQVATDDGYIGYIQKKKVSAADATTYERDFKSESYTYLTMDEPVNLVWHQTTSTDANNYFSDATQNMTGVNVISPTWFSIADNSGNITNIASGEYVMQAHEKGLKVWGLEDNFSENISTTTVLSSTSARQNLEGQLIAGALKTGLDGINVDFEKVTEDGSQDYIQFIRELSVACRQKGLVLSVDNYVPHNYNAHYKWAEQGVMADYVIIMGYDEHWGGSEVAGSVASLGYVTEGIERMTQEVSSEKVINAVPLYTRIWTTAEDGAVTSRAVGIQTAYDYMNKNQAVATWDNSVGQNYVEFETSDGTVQIWLEDEQSLEAKINVMKEHNLGGIAAWKLGFDDGRKNIWGVISGFAAE